MRLLDSLAEGRRRYRVANAIATISPERRAELAAERLRIRNRDQQALNLKLGGATYEQIATQLQYSDSKNAWRAVRALMTSAQAPAADVRAEEVARLDRLMLSWWPKALGTPANMANGSAAVPPDRHAAELVLKISERRARLLGLDKPFVNDIEDLVRAEAERLGEDPDEAVRIARELASEVRRGRIRLVS